MISRSSRLAVLGATALLTLAGAGVASAAQDPLPIGPHQYFSGVVNGQANTPTIRTDCAGPVSPGQTGHPVAGQYVEAVPASSTAAGTGYTGAAHTLQITLTTSSAGATGLIGSTTNYYAPLAIPTTLTVPCGGTGKVVLTPQPIGDTDRAATVTVNFISIGA